MKEKLKTIEKTMEKALTEYASEMDSGKQLTDKDPERIAHLSMALTFSKLLCMLEDVKEKGLSAVLEGSGKSESGGKEQQSNPMDMLKKMMGGGQQMGGFQPFQMPSARLGFGNDPYENNMPYQHHEDYDMENRRGRSRRTGRYTTRSAYDQDMDDRYPSSYDDGQNSYDRGGSKPQNTVSDRQGQDSTSGTVGPR